MHLRQRRLSGLFFCLVFFCLSLCPGAENTETPLRPSHVFRSIPPTELSLGSYAGPLPAAFVPDTAHVAVHLLPLQPIPSVSALHPHPGGQPETFMAMAGPASPIGAVASTPACEAERWLRNPVAIHADKYPLDRVLGQFAAQQGVAAKVSPRLEGLISGDVVFSDPGEFLGIISRTHMVNWYFDGVSVHFFPNDEMHARLLTLDDINEKALRNALSSLGLFDDRFEWRVTGDGKLLKVQGPEVYLNQIADILEREQSLLRELHDAAQAERQAERKEKKLQVIRLNHAWAEERTIATGNSSIKVPGVADLLRDILRQQSAPSRSTSVSRPLGSSSLHKGTGVIGRRRAEAATALETAAVGEPSATAKDSEDMAIVSADSRLNAVLVWDNVENHARNERIVYELDQPLAMVEIRAAIIEVEADRTRDLGIQMSAKEGGGNWTNNFGVNSTSGDDYTSVAGDGFNFTTIYSHGLDNLMIRVKAMEKEGAANVLSRPSVLTQDNIQAVLEQTETYYVKLEGYEEVDLADISTGLTMRVTPHIIDQGDGGIQMSVYLTTGSDSGSGTGSDYVPRVRQSTITTQAVVKEGEALVIGGYYNETRTKSETGVPLLRRLPVVGALFRTRNKLHTKVEKLFVLSPRIIYPGNSPMGVGTRAEYVMEHSPERDALDKSSEEYECEADKQERKKRRRLSLNID